MPDIRSERQTIAVDQRIAEMEKVSRQRKGALFDCFDVMYRHDTRSDINELHFWRQTGWKMQKCSVVRRVWANREMEEEEDGEGDEDK